jgi:hypothetical protein
MSTGHAVVDLAAVDAVWMTGALRGSGVLRNGRVTVIRREPCGTGQLADSYRFFLEYEPAGAGPATVVGKFPSTDLASRDFGRRSGYYRNEIRFYQDVAPDLPVVVPDPLFTALDDDHTGFVLLMSDLGPARAVDQLTGATADECAAVLEQVAALHAGSWHSEELAGVGWLSGTIASASAVTDGFSDVVAGFGDRYGDLIAEADVVEAAKLTTRQEAWKRTFSAPQCLWHTDLRADNVLFDVQGGRHRAALLDWQGVAFGRGSMDVAYFLGTSMTTDARRAHERALVAGYHAALRARGVQGYSAEDCWTDYRLGAIWALQSGIFGLGAVRRTPRGDAMWRSWIERAAAQTRDLDSFTALDGTD